MNLISLFVLINCLKEEDKKKNKKLFSEYICKNYIQKSIDNNEDKVSLNTYHCRDINDFKKIIKSLEIKNSSKITKYNNHLVIEQLS